MIDFLPFFGLLLYFAILLYAVHRDKKSKNVEDYFFAGRQLPYWALSITFIASWWGAGSAISTADLAFEEGLGAFWYYGVPVLLSTFCMIIGAKFIRGIGHLTQGAMMRARYSPLVGKLLSVLILLFMTFTAASQMVGVGMFLGSYLKISYGTAILLGSLIVLVYSMIGGFRGVVLTDIIQFILLVISAIAVFVVAMEKSGGFKEVAKVASEMGKTDFMSFTAGVQKYFMYVITFGCSWAIQANVWQRISATKTVKDAQKMTILSFFAYIPLYFIVVFTGMAAITLFDTLPDGGIVPAIVIDYMHPILGTFVFIGISAAIMSTMDSVINTAAMTLVLDLLPQNIKESKKLFYSKAATLGVTLVALIISLQIRSILDIAWIASDIITTGLFIPLVLGFLWKKGNKFGATASMIAGTLYCLYNLFIQFGFNLPTFWKLQSATQVLIGVAISLFLYVGVSLCTNSQTDSVA